MALRNVENILRDNDIDYARIDTNVKDYFDGYAEPIENIEDAKEFLRLLKSYRKHIESVTQLNGSNFTATIRGILGVGTNGIYSGNLRFLFELIQNVDDCVFATDAIPELSVYFVETSRKIVLRYNEMGFKPHDVFSITGIAERSKNVDARQIQIGEKGIGFKSVFGIVNSVLIRSGFFSFRLNQDHFTIPESAYDDEFRGCVGTELTLEFSSENDVRDVKDRIIRLYKSERALLCQNPVVFLNNLHTLKFIENDNEILSFSGVAKECVEQAKEEIVLPGCLPMFVIKDAQLCLNICGESKLIAGVLYSTEVCYTAEECESRYKNVNDFPYGRKLKLYAYFPDFQCIVRGTGAMALGKGVLYSYLPTKDEISVPIICHAPFKLSASREHVDGEHNNAWFRKTVDSLNSFIHRCYRLYCKEAGNTILGYIPKGNEHFFLRNDENGKLIAEERLKGSQIVKEKLFLCSDGSYHNAEHAVSISDCVDKNRAHDILRLLMDNRFYFASPAGFYPSNYNIGFITNANERLINEVILNAERSEDDIRLALHIVNQGNKNLIREKFRNYSRCILSSNQLRAFSNEQWFDDLVEILTRRVRDGNGAVDITLGQSAGEERNFLDLIGSGTQITYTDLGAKTRAYFERINGKCICFSRLGECSFCLPGNNFCLIVGDNQERQAIELCRKLDPSSQINLRLQFIRASAELDAAMDDAEPQGFMDLLRNVRQTTKDAMGESYKRFLALIQDAGMDSSRYLMELLQNADDCEYPETEVPTLNISSNGREMILQSNERGFRVRDVRSITAIGLSTARMLIGDPMTDRIGEKGIGFKSVFKVASSVEIHSGAFHFRIESNAPTIPMQLTSADETNGTEMRFTLNDDIAIPDLTREQLMDLCLCLRKLKRLFLFGHKIEINESNDESGQQRRRISIDNDGPKDYYKVVHPFTIAEQVLNERNVDGLRFTANQKITCYVPVQIRKIDYPLYCGLPTKTHTKIAVAIDAPFKLTTSREQVVEDGRWNECVRNEVYSCLLNAARQLHGPLGINVFYMFSFKRDSNEHIRNVYLSNVFSSQSAYLNENRELWGAVSQLNIVPVVGGVCTSPSDDKLRIGTDSLVLYLRDKNFVNANIKLVDFSGLAMSGSVKPMLSDIFTIKKLKEPEFWQLVDSIGDFVELIKLPEFRELLYEELAGYRRDDRVGIQYAAGIWQLPNGTSQHPIIPVIGTDGITRFVSKNSGKFYFSDCNRHSAKEYCIVDTSIMSCNMFREIFDETLERMTQAVIDEFYVSRVVEYVNSHTITEVYNFLLSEVGNFTRGLFVRIKYGIEGNIPLKDLNGDVSHRKMFLRNNEELEVAGQVLSSILVNQECLLLAQLNGCQPISELSYRDLPRDPFELQEADINDIGLCGSADSQLILALAADDGRISDKLIDQFGIIPLIRGKLVQDGGADDCAFPTQPIRDANRLMEVLKRNLLDPVFAMERTVTHVEKYWASRSGTELSSADANSRAREEGLRRYESGNAHGRCFCQICGKSKQRRNIEINSIEREPNVYFPEMHLTLCLECSAYYKELRNNECFVNDFLRLIREYVRVNDEDNACVSVPTVGEGRVNVSFTCRHLVEIQAILHGCGTTAAEHWG